MARLQGDLKFATVTGLLERSGEFAGESLDLSDVGAIDSAGVAFLLALRRHAAARGRTLSLHNAAPQISTLLHFYGVDTMFERESQP